MKLKVEAKDGKGFARGKVWPRDEPEPDAWTVELEDPLRLEWKPGPSSLLHGHTARSPGAEVYFDNIQVSPTSPDRIGAPFIEECRRKMETKRCTTITPRNRFPRWSRRECSLEVLALAAAAQLAIAAGAFVVAERMLAAETRPSAPRRPRPRQPRSSKSRPGAGRCGEAAREEHGQPRREGDSPELGHDTGRTSSGSPTSVSSYATRWWPRARSRRHEQPARRESKIKGDKGILMCFQIPTESSVANRSTTRWSRTSQRLAGARHLLLAAVEDGKVYYVSNHAEWSAQTSRASSTERTTALQG